MQVVQLQWSCAVKHNSVTVSVIIPTYNRSAVLPFSIGSVLRQTFTDFELLVIGDGCTDDSQTVVESINDQRVRWINLPTNSKHQSAPNNEGLRIARGELIAYLGHDDLWLPHHLRCLTEEIANGADLAYGIVGIVNEEGGSELSIPSAVSYERGMWIPPTSVVHKRALTEAVGGWRNYKELTVDPEADLYQRAYEAKYKLTLVRRLTSIKFPAAHRRDVYKSRPSEEQARWTQRILDEPDFELVEMAKVLISIMEGNRHVREAHIQYKDLANQFMAETWKRVCARLSSANKLGRSELSTVQKGERIDQFRKFKGLE